MKPFLAVIAICLIPSKMPAPAYAWEVKAAQSPPPRSTADEGSTKELSWEGIYTFSEDLGGIAGTGPMIAEHTIVIRRSGSKLIAEIDADGYQTIRRLRCDAKITGSRITFYFNSYREDNGFAPYKKGQMLLAFERASAGGRTLILTHWGAYKPIFRPLKSKSVYFVKTQ